MVQCSVRSAWSIYTFYLLVFYDNFVFVRNPWSMQRVDKTLESSVLSAFVDSFEFIETAESFDIGSWFFLWFIPFISIGRMDIFLQVRQIWDFQ